MSDRIIEIASSFSQHGDVSGRFRLLKGPLPQQVASPNARDSTYLIAPMPDDTEAIEKYGTHFGVFVWEKDIKIFNAEEIGIDKAAILEAIKERFYVMGLLTEGVISGNIRSFIAAGSAGIGKSHNLLKRMERAKNEFEINKYTVISGRMSAPVLYKHLWEHSQPGDVLVLDDVDVFNEDKSLEVLKGALDTTRRPITWGTQNLWLQEEGVPMSFDFDGSCVFISNQNFDRLANSNNKLSPHIKALISRSVYLDLLIHDPLQIMIWVDHIMRTSEIAHDLEMDEQLVDDILEWLWANYKTLRELSLRTPVHLSSFTKCHSDWKMMAKATMLKNNHL